MSIELGAQEREYAFDRKEWDRSRIVLGSMTLMGTAGVAIGCYRSVIGGSLDWMLILVGLVLALVSGRYLYLIRPGLLSIAIHENGLRVVERDGESETLWGRIAKIEECVYRSRHGDVPQIMIETVAGTHLLVMSQMLVSYDDFLASLRKKAADHDVRWEHL